MRLLDADDDLDGLWEGLDGTFVLGAPLTRAYENHPSLARLLQAAWRVDPEAFGLDGSDVRDLIVRRLTGEHGIPRWLAASHADAEAWVPATQPDGGGGPGPVDGLVTAMRSVATLPSSWLPKGDEWNVVMRCAAMVRACGEMVGTEALPAFLNVGGDWVDWERRVMAAIGMPDRKPEDAFLDAGDVVRALQDEVVLPALWIDAGRRCAHLHRAFAGEDPHPGRRPTGDGGESPPAIGPQGCFALTFGHVTVRRVLERSRAWHMRRAAMLAAIAALPSSAPRPQPTWGAGLPDEACGDLSLVVLTTRDQLLAEGSDWPDADGVPGLSHCVGGYSNHCLSGLSRIASIRRAHPDGRTERLSTVEFQVRKGAWVLSQHRGRSNGEPPPDAATLVGDYARRLVAGETKVDAAGLSPMPRPPEAGRSGYDHAIPGNWERVVTAWGGLLPRGVRSLDPQGWRELVDGLRVS